MHARGLSLCRVAMGGLFTWNGVSFYGTDHPNDPGDRGLSRGLSKDPDYDYAIGVNKSDFDSTGFPAGGETISHDETGRSYAVIGVDHTPNSEEAVIRLRNRRA